MSEPRLNDKQFNAIKARLRIDVVWGNSTHSTRDRQALLREIGLLRAERDEARSALAAMVARSCGSCRSYKLSASHSGYSGYCQRHKAGITSGWCCKEWEPKPLPENDRDDLGGDKDA